MVLKISTLFFWIIKRFFVLGKVQKKVKTQTAFKSGY